MGKKDKSSKRKSRESEVATDILPHKNKDGNVIDDLSEPTMGEKLANLNLEENDKAMNLDIVDVAPNAKPPSADSVYILLKQALRADDRALLIDCLYRQDEKVITNSLSVLNPSDVLQLLQSLVAIIQLKGAVLACALPWLRSLLLLHAGSIMSQDSSLAALNSIYQLIESRVSNFDRALQLSSCLDLLYAETVDDEMEENDVATPVIYEDDDDDSDDEGVEDSMDVESVEDGEEEPQAYSDISDDEENGKISE
ncbi:U3 small nucleolar RNA-associated protein 5 [Phtheirospermum japonicum]|uniref:U3 small nucleolar RNA-associated protein 5 n=1 Tax=Phtheirospermum japonicum TaxID=374723 RepID=A0A830D383_9LAMI|nr:U3 small nucleolar RNA-associated protein 5 [Phtheirospermum japonicum]